MSAAMMKRLEVIRQRLKPDTIEVIREPSPDAPEQDHRAFAAAMESAKASGERVVTIERSYLVK